MDRHSRFEQRCGGETDKALNATLCECTMSQQNVIGRVSIHRRNHLFRKDNEFHSEEIQINLCTAGRINIDDCCFCRRHRVVVVRIYVFPTYAPSGRIHFTVIDRISAFPFISDIGIGHWLLNVVHLIVQHIIPVQVCKIPEKTTHRNYNHKNNNEIYELRFARRPTKRAIWRTAASNRPNGQMGKWANYDQYFLTSIIFNCYYSDHVT